MTFKLGSENRKNTYGSGKNRFSKDDASIPGTPILRKDLPKGIKGEANNDGSIFISNEIQPGSDEEKKVLMHEMKHIVDMKTGKLAYTDHDITWMGEKYPRAEGKIHYDGKWLPEGDVTFPWEQH